MISKEKYSGMWNVDIWNKALENIEVPESLNYLDAQKWHTPSCERLVLHCCLKSMESPLPCKIKYLFSWFVPTCPPGHQIYNHFTTKLSKFANLFASRCSQYLIILLIIYKIFSDITSLIPDIHPLPSFSFLPLISPEV